MAITQHTALTGRLKKPSGICSATGNGGGNSPVTTELETELEKEKILTMINSGHNVRLVTT
jgi:hypothetical protein